LVIFFQEEFGIFFKVFVIPLEIIVCGWYFVVSFC